jgi:hypothetical protein
MGLRVASALTVLLLLGCPAIPEQEEIAIELGDVDSFSTYVQPVIRDTCTSLDCHGKIERPLRLYAIWGLRIDSSQRDMPETSEEMAANADAMFTMDPDLLAGESLVLLKPLAVDAGGMKHEGDDIFETRDAPGFVCLQAWLDGELSTDTAAQAACQDAAVPIP